MLPVVQTRYIYKAFLREPHCCGNSNKPGSFEKEWWVATVNEIITTSLNVCIFVSFQRYDTQIYRMFTEEEFLENYLLI